MGGLGGFSGGVKDSEYRFIQHQANPAGDLSKERSPIELPCQEINDVQSLSVLSQGCDWRARRPGSTSKHLFGVHTVVLGIGLLPQLMLYPHGERKALLAKPLLVRAREVL